MGKKIFSIPAVFLFVFFLCAPAQAISIFQTDSLTGHIEFSGFGDGSPETFKAIFSKLDGTVNATAVADGWYDVYAEGTVWYKMQNEFTLPAASPQLIYSGKLSSTGLTPGNYSFPFGTTFGSDIPFNFSIGYDGNASPQVMAGLTALGFPFVNSDGAGTLGVVGEFNAGGSSAVVDFTESDLTWTGFGGVLWMLDNEGNGNGDGILNVDFSLTNVNITAAPVPEPSTILLMGIGLLGLVGYSRKRKKS